MPAIRPFITMLVLALAMISSQAPAVQGPANTQDSDFQQSEEKRTDAYATQLESWLRAYLVDRYPERASKAWKRDYSSIPSYEKSVEVNRAGWRNVVMPPQMAITGEVRHRPHPPLQDLPIHRGSLQRKRKKSYERIRNCKKRLIH